MLVFAGTEENEPGLQPEGPFCLLEACRIAVKLVIRHLDPARSLAVLQTFSY